jgi:hypothetical protein
MKEIINHVRNQPEEVRRHILHALTVVFAIILIMLWVYSLGTNLMNLDTQVKIGQDLKPFSALRANMVDGYDSISHPNTNPSNTDPNADLRNQLNNF